MQQQEFVHAVRRCVAEADSLIGRYLRGYNLMLARLVVLLVWSERSADESYDPDEIGLFALWRGVRPSKRFQSGLPAYSRTRGR